MGFWQRLSFDAVGMLLLRILVVAAALSPFMVNPLILPNPIGETVPNGDIFVDNDGILEIICTLYGNTTYGNMKFVADEYDVSPYVSKVNATSIRLYIKHPKPQMQMYFCLLGEQIVNQNFVVVTVTPSKMKCISYNYERLNCSFKSSKLSSDTKYEGKYELIGNRYNDRGWSKIDNVITLNNEDYYFVLDSSTSLPYRFAYGEIRLFLKISIDIPKSHKPKEYILNTIFNESKHVIPGPAEKLKVSKITVQYINIAYVLPSSLHFRTYSVQHMIIWSCSCGEKQWDGEDSFITSIRSIEYQMTDLPYAYALCNFSVYLKVAQAANDSMWSNNSTIENIRSGSKAPESPPETLEGAFQIHERLNNSIIYWKDIPEEFRNGPNFTYAIDVINGSKSVETQIENNFAILKNLNVSINNTVEIRSKNSVGFSNKTELVIPNINDTIVRELGSFTQWTNSSGITHLSWELPKHIGENLTNEWVVFACNSWNEEMHLCDGLLEPVDTTKAAQGNVYYVSGSSTDNTKYAITFKTLRSWTGLLWTKCKVENRSSTLRAIHLSIVNVGRTKIGVRWILHCKDMVVPISGYELSYCKASEKLEECDGEIKNITIKGDKSMGEYNIENLDFQSRYLIWVKTESHFAIQQRSNVTEYRNAYEPVADNFWVVTIICIAVAALLLFSIQMFYKKTKRCSNIGVILPSGLQIYDTDEKQPSLLDRPLNTKIPEIIPNQCNEEEIPPTPTGTSRRNSQVSQQSLITRNPENPNFQECEDDSDVPSDVNSTVPDVVSTSPKGNKEPALYVPFNKEKIPPSPTCSSRSSEVSQRSLITRNPENPNFQECEDDDINGSDVPSDGNNTVPDVVSTSPKRNTEPSRYVPFEALNNFLVNGNVSATLAASGNNSEENQADDISNHSDILSDEVPDVVSSSPKRNKESTPYVTAGNSSREDQAMTSPDNEHSTQYIPLEERNAPIPTRCINYDLPPEEETTRCRSYVPFSSYVPNAEAAEAQNNFQHPYVMVTTESDLTSQISQYVPLNFQNNTEEEEEPLMMRAHHHVLPRQLEATTRL